MLHTDDTTVKNIDPPPGNTATARFWCYLGDAAHPYNVFDFTPNRKRDGPQQFPRAYQGYLQADAFSGYDLYLPCAHAQAVRPPRGSVQRPCDGSSMRRSDAVRSHQAARRITASWRIERRATELKLDESQRLRLRQDLAVPVLQQFHDWLEKERVEVLPKSPMGEAFGYALHGGVRWCVIPRPAVWRSTTMRPSAR